MKNDSRSIELGTAHFPSGRVSVSDSSYFFDDPVIIEIEPGRYEVSITVGARGEVTSVFFARTRALHRARPCGTFGVDFGQVCVCDRSLAESTFEGLGDEGMGQYHDALDTTTDVEVVKVADCEFLLARPGNGDGRYRVWELVGDATGTPCGFEVDFSDDDPKPVSG